MWISIAAEENARRCKPSQEAWVTNRYPLRELGLNRADWEAWLLKHYKIVVSKSVCLGCCERRRNFYPGTHRCLMWKGNGGGHRHYAVSKSWRWRLVKKLALFWCHEPVVETEPAT
jgi:hypothetical protein